MYKFNKIYLDTVNSTHKYLKEYINENSYEFPIVVITKNQTDGIGSRGNNWEGLDGNLFFSFVIDKKLLPQDLKIQSSSIYFSFILKEELKRLGSDVWIKWPNDFYIDNKKIGGTITTLSNNLVYCGIGLNLIKINNFGVLDIKIDIHNLLDRYFNKISQTILWKDIFNIYKKEFYKSKNLTTTIDNIKQSLKEATLQNDGSLLINGKIIHSLR